MMDRKRRAARRNRTLAPAAEVLELRQLLTTYTGQLTRDHPTIYAPSVVNGGDYSTGTFTVTMDPPSDVVSFGIAITSSDGFYFNIEHDGAEVSGTATYHADVHSSEEKFTIVPTKPIPGSGSVTVTATITAQSNSGEPGAQFVIDGSSTLNILIKGRTPTDPGPTTSPEVPTSQAGNQGGACCTPPQALSTDGPGKKATPTTATESGSNGATGADSEDPPALYSDGFGKEWGLTSEWTSVSAYSAGGALGKGFVNLFQPTVQPTSDGVMIVSSATDVEWFTSGPGGYTPKFFGQETLVVTGSGGTSEYVLTDTQGDVTRFYGPGASASLTGKFKSFTDPYGHQVTTQYDALTGRLTWEQRADGTTVEKYVYSYIASGVNAGLVDTVTLSRSGTPVRAAKYTYYAGGTTGGNAGDLQLEQILDASGAVVLDTTYFRYYTPTDTGGYTDGLKYVFHEEAYARLAANVANPLTAADAVVAPYADTYREYDSDQRVTRKDVQGAGCSCVGSGAGTYSYTYASSPFTSASYGDFNTWRSKTVETLPDGNQNVYYYNFAGEPILKVFSDVGDSADSSLTGKVWATYYKYDEVGRLIMTAQPSAVAITTPAQLTSAEANPDLVGWNASAGTYQYLAAAAGVINTYDYAAVTTGGDVAGYLKADSIKNGYGGTPIQLDGFTYTSHADANGAVVHPLASTTVYSGAGGTGARTTSYTYTWYGTTNQAYSIAVALPIVGSTQNGPGSADVETTWFDAYGRPTWFKDADGYISYTAYDVGTGAVVKTIADVDTTRTGDFANLPAGLATPSGGGLHLVTSYDVDGLGRTTKETDPATRVTYRVYDDVAHEVRTYRGWNAATGTTTGPIEVTRYDYGHAFDETFTMAATPDKVEAPPGSGKYVPTGVEAVSNLRSLSRTLYDKGGRVIEVDAYFNLDGLTYSATTPQLGAVDANYYATTYGYDDRGRMSRVVDPLRTITFYKYDSLGRLSTTSVGTNDPYDGNPDSNMKVVARYEYDGGGAVGDGNLTKATAYPDDASPADDRVAQYAYDWRDRLVAVKGGVQATEGTTVNRPLVYYGLDNLGEVTSVSLYDGDGVALSSSTPAEGSRRAYTEYAYDDQGRVYSRKTYSIDQATGAKTSTNYLSTSVYYDRRGDVIADFEPGGLVSKARYDGAGRLVDSASTDGAGGTTWAAAGTLAGDHVLTETRLRYNGAGDSILVTSLDRDHDAGAATGPLFSPGSTGPGDGGFESAPTSTYVPNPTGTPWTFLSNAGVSANGSGFTGGNPDAPQGGQVAYIQYSGSISQTSDWQAGTYTISLKAAQRGNYGGSQTIQLKVDGVVVGTFTPAGTAYQTFSATFTIAAAGSHTIMLAGNSTADNTAFVDDVAVAVGSSDPVEGDSGFEDRKLAPTTYVAGDGSFHVAGSSWSYYAAGVASNGSTITNNNPGAPQGDQVAYIQYAGSIWQTITGWQAGSYTVSFKAAQCANLGGGQSVQVVIDGVVVATFTPAGTAYQTFAATFAVTAGTHTIAFTNTSNTPAASLIDGVSIAATDARASYSAYYYDAAHRLIQAADLGTNGGAAYTRPVTGPARSDAVHVTDYYYDDAGRVAQTTDPRGLVTRYGYDALGRVVETVANATTAWPAPVGAATDSTNNTTRFTYDGLDHVRTVVAVMPTGTTSQTTTYNYGITTASGSKIDSNGVLGSVVQSDGAATTYAYNALGQVVKATDAVGTTHDYAYDVVGRLVSDAVTTLGSGVDGAVQRIETAYDTAGRAYLFTSYGAATGGSIVNQVLDQFNGYGQLTAEYQSHSGAVDTSTTPEVQYAYTTPTTGQNYSRPTKLTYPNGRAVRFVYDASGTGIDSAISRLSSIADDATGTTLESYKYLGLGTIVERAQPEAKVKLTYVRQAGDAAADSDGGDQYTGLDRFGRVIDENWVRTSASAGGAAAGTSTVRIQYGYDRDDDALFRHDLVFEALDDLYQYDGLNRLASYKRGVLSKSTAGGPYDTVASPYNQQSWSLDAQGNWGGYTADGSTTAKTFDAANQVASVNGSTTGIPTYDADGNTKTKDGRSYVYDAWNRLVAVKSGATTLASYAYDALRRRIKETAGSATTDLYFTPDSQPIEERAGGTAAANVSYQYVYGATGQMVLRDAYSGGSVVPGSRLYAQQDANGDVVALVGGATATAGDPQERYWYSPYGVVGVLAGSGAGRPSGTAYAWRNYFQGGRLDAATGLYAFGLRDYDPSTGVWMERDPIGLDAGDPNLYRFVGNNPVTWVDPVGLLRLFGQTFVAPWDPNAAGIGGTLGAYVQAGKVAVSGTVTGAAAGSLSGAGAGALIGSAAGPGGTLAGAGAGASAGAVGGGISGLISAAFGDASDITGASGQAVIPGLIGGAAPGGSGAFSKLVGPGGLGGGGGAALVGGGSYGGGIVVSPGAMATGSGIVGAGAGALRSRMYSTGGSCPTNNTPNRVSPGDLTPTHRLNIKSGRAKKEFEALKADIKANGIKDPIKYVECGDSKYVVDGHHRLRAAKELGFKDVPAQRVEVPYGGYKTLNDLFDYYNNPF